jgi:hypothetical protein
MDVPEIPPILTEANWNKNKGALAKAAGKTGLGALLKELAAAHNRVDWDALDMDAALPDEASAEAASAALAVAKRQMQTNLPLLLKKIEAVEDQARLTQAKFGKHKLIPAATVKHVGQLADAAKTLTEDVKALDDEYEAFEKAVAVRVKQAKDAKAKQKLGPQGHGKAAVKDVAGEKWFAGLAKLTLHREAAVARWALNSDIAASADDALFRIDRRFDPRTAQSRFETQLKKFRVIIEQIKALQDRTLERKEAVVKLQAGSRALSDAFDICLQSVEATLQALKSVQQKNKDAYDAWHSAHPDVMRQTEQAFTALEKQKALVEALEQAAQKLKKD